LDLVVVLPPLLRPEVLLLEVMPLLRRSLLRRRRRVSQISLGESYHMLILYIAKEESDEDMGFGLFD
jgi:hypothetical protein